MQRFEINDGTACKMVEIVKDPKRKGMLFCRCYGENGIHLGSMWGKSQQFLIKAYMRNGTAA